MRERDGSDLRERARPLARPENFGRIRDGEGLSPRMAGFVYAVWRNETSTSWPPSNSRSDMAS